MRPRLSENMTMGATKTISVAKTDITSYAVHPHAFFNNETDELSASGSFPCDLQTIKLRLGQCLFPNYPIMKPKGLIEQTNYN